MFKIYWYQLCLAKPFVSPDIIATATAGSLQMNWWPNKQQSVCNHNADYTHTDTQTHTHSALLPYITYKDSGSSCRPTTHHWVHSSSSQLIAKESNVTLLVSESTDSHHQHPKAATTKTNVLLIVIGNKPNGRVPSWASFWHGFVIAL